MLSEKFSTNPEGFIKFGRGRRVDLATSHGYTHIRSMEKFVEYCRSRYNDDEHRLKVIDEFEHTYRPDFSVSWYTRDSVFYQVITLVVVYGAP